MKLIALWTALACALFYSLPELISPWWSLLLLALAAAVRKTGYRIATFPVAFSWCLIYTTVTQPAAIQNLDLKHEYSLQGTVISVPEQRGNRIRFIFRVDDNSSQLDMRQSPLYIRVSWRKPLSVEVGQVWQLPLRIKPIHGYANPGGWDYERWAFVRGIGYTAYVRSTDNAELLAEATCCYLSSLRNSLKQILQKQQLSREGGAVIMALGIGDRSRMSSELKELFSATGIMHLVAISGLHIGMVAGAVFLLANALWRFSPSLCQLLPAHLAAMTIGVVVALLYALLSGFALPAQRAFIMLLVFLIATLARIRINRWDVLALAFVLVLFTAPYSIIEAGLWLSFTAVAVIFALLPTLEGRRFWQQAVILQLGISIALTPMLWAFSMPSSVLGPLINLVLIPIFSFLIVPGVLIGILLLPLWESLAQKLLGILDYLVSKLIEVLRLLDNAQEYSAVSQHYDVTEWALLISGVFLLLSVWRRFFLFLVPVLLSISLFPKASFHEEGDFELTVLDVGQGLSAVVETKNHVLIFDTGPAYGNFNTAKAVVVPFLEEKNLNEVAALVISHGDKDHAGGYASLMRRYDFEQVLVGEPGRKNIWEQQCHSGIKWDWDGVRFSFLHPEKHNELKGNNSSCVLQVSNGVNSILLTGDIEQRVEQNLVRSDMLHNGYDVVVAPHHGSKSSSSNEFIEATQPKYIIYSAGRFNRYGFPNPKVVERWRAVNALALNTGKDGAASFLFRKQGRNREGLLYRRENPRLWRKSAE